MGFIDRADAGRRLAGRLQAYADQDPIVLALPRGGTPVAAEAARALKAPLDLVMVRKLGAPGEPELAMGAVAVRGEPVVVWNPDIVAALRIPLQSVQAVYQSELSEIARRRALYLGGRPPISAEGRAAIVIDDGLATGATMEAALKAVRAERPRTLVMAVPVASREALARVRADADAVVCLETPEPFLSVGRHYRHFGQTSDQEVVAALQAADAEARAAASPTRPGAPS